MRSRDTTAFHVRIGRIYDHLYANASVKTPSAIAYEFGKFAHTCLFIEQSEGKVPAIELSMKDQKAISEGGTLLIHSLADSIRSSFQAMVKNWDLYADDPKIKLKDFDLAYCGGQVSGVWFSNPKADAIGDIFEIIRSQFAKEKGGQFFTDSHVTHLAMTLLQFDPLKGEDLIDICAGTGGFLLAGMAHLEERVLALKQKRKGKLAKIVASQFVGIEIDPDAALAANATIKARFGQAVGDIVSTADSLLVAEKKIGKLKFKTHTCGATNPPFGTKITIKDPNVLKHFDLARLPFRPNSISNGQLSPQAPDTLFLEQNIKLITPETGRLAIVVPYQILSGPKALPIREWILKNTLVRAVIDLPADTFQPHTGTKGGLLVVTPRKQPLKNVADAENDLIFMATPKHIGHDRRGNPIYRPSSDGAEILTDLPDVGEAFRLFLAGENPSKEYPECFTTTTSHINGNAQLNLNAAYYRFDAESLPARTLPSGKNWATIPLKDLTHRIFFPGRFKRSYVAPSTSSIRFLGGANIRELLVTGEKFLSDSDPNLESLVVQAGWILLTRSGSTGIVSSVPAAWANHAVSEHVIRIVPNEKKIPGAYIFAVLSSEYGQAYLRKGIFGSVIDEITPEFVGELGIPVPTDPSLISEIVDPIQKAERMRNDSIQNFEKGSLNFERLLSK